MMASSSSESESTAVRIDKIENCKLIFKHEEKSSIIMRIISFIITYKLPASIEIYMDKLIFNIHKNNNSDHTINIIEVPYSSIQLFTKVSSKKVKLMIYRKSLYTTFIEFENALVAKKFFDVLMSMKGDTNSNKKT
jgi:uncharacterized membrane protein